MSPAPQEEAAAPAEARPKLVSLREHPRALGLVRRAKAFGGLVAFAAVALGSLMHGATAFDAASRGLLAGIVGFHATWLAAIVIARQILRARTLAAVEAALERRRRLQASRS